MRFKSGRLATVGLTLGLCAVSVHASDFSLPRGGRVTLEFLNARDASPSTLSLASPGAVAIAASGCQPEPAQGLPGLPLLTGRAAQRGCRVTLDADPATPGTQPFSANTTFSFRLCVQTDPTTPACERVWSSNSAQVKRVAISDRAFRFSWEHDPAGSRSDFDDLRVVLRIDGDRDGDGLWDDWEDSGIDADGNGTIDLRLPGADSRHKDVFVELDWMSCALAGSDCAPDHRGPDDKPPLEAIDEAVAVFAEAPVGNPDGRAGIRLHVDLSNPIRHQNMLDLGCFGQRTFAAVKAEPGNFGPNNPRRFAYHYGIFGHGQDPNDHGSGGCAELRGNDFLVTLATWRSVLVPPNGVRLHAGSLLHELGHNLGLRHGGDDDVDLKPNYLSVMNSRYEHRGLPPDGRLDYSRRALPTIDETHLSDLRTLRESVMYACPDLRTTDQSAICISAPGKPIDWNCNGQEDAGPFTLDLNRDRFCVRPLRTNKPLKTCTDPTDPQCQKDNPELLMEFGEGRGAFKRFWLADGPAQDPPDRVCDNAALPGDPGDPDDPGDQQLRPVGSRQPPLLAGFADWGRLRYGFQIRPNVADGASQELADGSEVSVQEEVDPDVNGPKPILVVTEFRTSPRGAVRPGSLLTLVTRLENLGSLDAENVIMEQPLPAGTRFVRCEPAALCELKGTFVEAKPPTLACTPGPACQSPATGTFTLTVVVRVSASTPEGTRLLAKVKAREGQAADPEEALCGEGEPFSPRRAALSIVVSSCPAGTHVIQGTPGSDNLQGTDGDDCLLGGEGDDILSGGEGNDVLIGGPGQDILTGGPGDDRLEGGEGNDQMDGGDGDDVLLGEEGFDILAGGFGDDQLDGGPGLDACIGGGSPGDRFTDCEQQAATGPGDPGAAHLEEANQGGSVEEGAWASSGGSMGPWHWCWWPGGRPRAPLI